MAERIARRVVPVCNFGQKLKARLVPRYSTYALADPKYNLARYVTQKEEKRLKKSIIRSRIARLCSGFEIMLEVIITRCTILIGGTP